jgi:hypothetical protein
MEAQSSSAAQGVQVAQHTTTLDDLTQLDGSSDFKPMMYSLI